MVAQNFLYSIPDYINENFYSKEIKIDVEDNAFVMRNLVSRVKKGYIDATIRFEFDRWIFYSVLVNVKTRGSTLVPAKFIMPNMQFEGDAACDLIIDVILAEGVTLRGSIFAQDIDGTFSLFSGTEEEIPQNTNYFYTKVDLDMLVGQHGRVFFSK